MQHCLRYFSLLLALILVGGGFSSCSNDDTDNTSAKLSFEVSLGAVGPNSAEINLKTTGIAEYAWLCYPADKVQEPTSPVIFATGTTGACKNGTTTVTIPDLENMSGYVVCFAAKTVKNAFYDGVIAPVSFTTTDYTDEVTIAKRTLDGFAVHIKLPKEVTDRGNVIKWTIGNIIVDNMNKLQGVCDAASLESNDEYYGKYFSKSTTLTFDEKHRIKTDENGQPIIDEWGYPVEIWEPVSPGEPIVLVLGEHEYGESMVGWGKGWYLPMFDYNAYFDAIGEGPGPLLSRSDEVSEADFWSGYYKRVEVRATEPTALDATVKFETVNLRPNGGTLHFTPDAKVTQYCIGVFDNAMFVGQVMPLLNNDESLLQWCTSSYAASVLFMTQTHVGAGEVLLEEMFYELTPGVPYHVLITGMGDEKGSTQCFSHETFELPMPTEPAPDIVVKGIQNPNGADSPYEVWFNVKAPNKDVEKAIYAANYLREFEASLSQGYTYADLIGQNASAGTFAGREISAINSDNGLNVSFPSREDAAWRLAVMAWNSEGTPSNPDAEASPAVADMRTIRQPDAERVESSLFTDLVGDWTATATVKIYKTDFATGDSGWVDVAELQKTKISISAGVTYPVTLPSDVYELYPDHTKEQVDGFYAEFKANADIFNSKTRGQNRLLCMGFEFDANPEAFYPALETATPYELFVNPDYNSSIEGLFYDFGPKWFMQITSGGDVFVPVNIDRLAPLTSWTDSNPYFLAPTDLTAGLYAPAPENANDVTAWPNIPVKVSSDKNTVTLKAVNYTTEDNVQHTFYPSVAYLDWGQMASFKTKVVSEVVLTRGWTEPAKAKASAKVHRGKNAAVPSMSSMLGRTLKSANNAVVKPLEKPMSRTRFPKGAAVHYKRIEGMHAVTPEELKANMLKYAERLNKRTVRK